MQLTKDDVKRRPMTNTESKEYGLIECISLLKFQQVRKFYNNYKDKDWCEELEPLWRHRDMTIRNWNDWLFSYCFKDGLK